MRRRQPSFTVMNHLIRASRFLALNFLTMLGLFFAPQGSLWAQQPAGPPTPVDRRAAERKAVVDQSTALFSARDYANGEKILLSDNRAKPNSLEWSLESAGKLVQMALRLRANYDHRGAIAVANRALVVLQEAKGLPGSPNAAPRRLGAWYELNGFIHENLLVDRDSAKASYEQALRANPGSLNAQNALARIADEEATHARISAKGGKK